MLDELKVTDKDGDTIRLKSATRATPSRPVADLGFAQRTDPKKPWIELTATQLAELKEWIEDRLVELDAQRLQPGSVVEISYTVRPEGSESKTRVTVQGEVSSVSEDDGVVIFTSGLFAPTVEIDALVGPQQPAKMTDVLVEVLAPAPIPKPVLPTTPGSVIEASVKPVSVVYGVNTQQVLVLLGNGAWYSAAYAKVIPKARILNFEIKYVPGS